MADFDPGDAPEGHVAPEPMRRGRRPGSRRKALAATVEDHEFVDPTLTVAERLLWRLFHERGVKRFPRADDPRGLPLLATRDRGHAAQFFAS